MGRFFHESLANQNEGIVEKTRKIQEDNVQVLKRDDGSTKNITIIDKKNIHNNFLQVINQYVIGTADGAKHDNRYDVTILVNGLPLFMLSLRDVGLQYEKHLIRSTDIRETAFGLAQDSLSMFSYL